MPQRLSDVDLADLVPVTRTWNNGEPISLADWICICIFGSYEHMISYGELFWPDFVEHDGCILLAGGEGGYAGFMEQTGGNTQAVEAVINHVHVIDLIDQPDAEPTRSLSEYSSLIAVSLWYQRNYSNLAQIP